MMNDEITKLVDKGMFALQSICIIQVPRVLES